MKVTEKLLRSRLATAVSTSGAAHIVSVDRAVAHAAVVCFAACSHNVPAQAADVRLTACWDHAGAQAAAYLHLTGH